MRSKRQDVNLHRAQRGEIDGISRYKVRTGREGEVVDVLAGETEGLRSVRVGLIARGDATGTDDVVARDGESDVVGPEVREELRGCVVLVAVPGTVPEDADLGEPLSTHDEVALVAVARNREWKFIVEGEVKGDRVVRSQWARQRDL